MLKIIKESNLLEYKYNLIQKIKSEFKNKLYKIATSEEFGFDEDEVDDYFYVNVKDLGDAIKVEVRAEVDYEGLEYLMSELNPIVYKYDQNSYFEPVTSGIIEAYINKEHILTKRNKIKENQLLEDERKYLSQFSEEEIKSFVDSIDFDEMEMILRNVIGIDNLKLKIEEPDISKISVHISYESDNLIEYCGIMKNVFNNVVLDDFGAGVFVENGKLCYSAAPHLSWNHLDGGYNGAKLSLRLIWNGKEWL